MVYRGGVLGSIWHMFSQITHDMQIISDRLAYIIMLLVIIGIGVYAALITYILVTALRFFNVSNCRSSAPLFVRHRGGGGDACGDTPGTYRSRSSRKASTKLHRQKTLDSIANDSGGESNVIVLTNDSCTDKELKNNNNANASGSDQNQRNQQKPLEKRDSNALQLIIDEDEIRSIVDMDDLATVLGGNEEKNNNFEELLSKDMGKS